MTNVQKLKKLRVYRKFVSNLKTNRGENGLRELNNVDTYIDSKNIEVLMWVSFVWINTPEGHDFWEEISIKILDL